MSPARFVFVWVAILGGTPLQALANPFSIEDFIRISGPEFLSPQFDSGGGQTTVGVYSGFVEVLASGTGLDNVNTPDVRSDAFYNFSATTNNPITFFGNALRLGTETMIEAVVVGPKRLPTTFVPNCSLALECGSLHAAELAVAYAGGSFPIGGDHGINDGMAPVYDSGHSYRFVVDLGGYAGTLTFGYGDGGTFDNAGAYDITVFQAAFVPEPGSLGLFVLGLLVAGHTASRPDVRTSPRPPSSVRGAE